MSNDDSLSPSRQQRLEQVLAEYVRSVEQAQPRNQQQLLDAHPDLADDLRSFFANYSAAERIAEPLKGSGYDPTIGTSAGDSQQAANLVRYFGDYELLEELGRGGMGVVYKARQTTLNRLVALKMILSGQLATADDVVRFKQEAEAAANLDHPHIAPIYETGEYQGQHYFSMKLIEGRSLRDALPELRHDRAALQRGVALLAQVCRAIHHAHQRGVLHRDLKPGNVLLDQAGTPYVTDFGLAKRVEGGSDVTRTGAIVGTPSYMAPEQASGVKQLTTAVDVYSLGAILFELFTGQPPFRGDSPLETLMQVTVREAVSPRSLNPAIDRDLETITLKCLEKDADRRYDSAAALANDLECWLRSEPIGARPATFPERAFKWARRRPASAALVGVCLIASMVLAVAGAYFVNRLAHERNKAIEAKNNETIERGKAERAAQEEAAARRHADEARQAADAARKTADAARDQADAERKKAEKARTHAEQQRDRAEWLAYSAQLGKVQREWNDIAQPMTVAHDLLSACQWNRRGWEHDYFYTLIRHRGQRTVAYFPSGVEGLAFSPDGKRLAVRGEDVPIRNYDVDTSVQVLDIETGDSRGIDSSVVFNHDGTRIASCGAGNSAGVWDAKTGKPIRLFNDHTHFVREVMFSPNGSRLATRIPRQTRGTSFDPSHICIWNVQTGEKVITLTEKDGEFSYMAWHPTNDQLVTGSFKGKLIFWNPQDGRELHSQSVRTESRYGIAGLAFRRDGKEMALSHQNGEISLRKPENGEELRSLSTSTKGLSNLLYSSDGRRLAGSAGNVVIVLDCETGAIAATYRRPIRNVKCLAFHPDAQRVASASGTAIKLWEVEGLHADKLIPAHSAAVVQVFSSGDGKLLASSASDQTVKLWDVRSAEDLELNATFEVEHFISQLRLSLDGKRVVIAVRKQEKPVAVQVPTSDATSKLAKTLALSSQLEEIRIYDTSSQQLLQTLPGHEPYSLSALAISPGGQFLATGDYSGNAIVRETESGKIVLTFRSSWGFNNVGDLAFSPDGRWLGYSGASDGMLRIFDCRDWREVHSLTPRDGFYTGGIGFSPDSQRIVIASEDGTQEVWDVMTGKELLSLRGHIGDVWTPAFSPDGRRIVSGSGGVCHVWDATLGQYLLTMSDDTNCTRAAFIQGGETLVRGRRDGKLQLRVASQRQDVYPLKGHTDVVNAAAYSPDGAILATASDDSKIKFWDAHHGLELRTLSGHAGSVKDLAFSPDGKLLASAGDTTVRLWDVESGEEHAVLKGHTQAVTSLAFRPDGKRLVSGSYDHTIRLWDVAKGELTATWKDSVKQVLCVAYSADGRRIASSGHDPDITLWDDTTGKPIDKLKGHNNLVLDVAFSADGRLLASVGADSKVLLREVATGKVLPSPQGHKGYVYGLAFSPDSRWLATGAMDNTVRVWDVATNREVITFRGHDYTVNAIAFHPHGKRVASVGYGPRRTDDTGPGQMRVWDIPTLDPDKPVEIQLDSFR